MTDRSRDVPAKPVATISVDLDSARTHLRGYGDGGGRPGPDRLLEIGLPRLLEMFDELGIGATFFVVAGDPPSTDLLRLLAGRHEVAAHSVTHPMPFARLEPARLRHEIVVAREAIAEATGTDVIGFRAPNWDVTEAVWDALAEAGYRYDASLLPTPLQAVIRTVLALRARRLAPLTTMPPLPPSWRRRPHRRQTAHGPLWIYPVPVTPTIRMPIYHTMRYRMSPARFAGALDGIARRREWFGYALHAVDVIAANEPGIPVALGAHPGMEHTRERKVALLRESLAAIVERFSPMTYRDHLAVIEAGAPGRHP